MDETFEFECRGDIAILKVYLAVMLIYDMENDIVVAFVEEVVMSIPVGRVQVHLYVAHPFHAVDAKV